MSCSQDAEKQRAALDGAQEGLRLLSVGDYEGAVVACTDAIKLDARSLGAYRTRAQAYERMGMGKEAQADYRHLGVETAPRSVAKTRNAWLATLLNLLPLPVGLGYIYLGRPGRFLLTLLGAIAAFVLGWVLAVAIWISARGDCPFEQQATVGCVSDDELLLANTVGVLSWIILGILLALFTARDAWRIAEGTQVPSHPGASSKPDDGDKGPLGAIRVGVVFGAVVGALVGTIFGGIVAGAIVVVGGGTIIHWVRR